jgi:hypothetical protein
VVAGEGGERPRHVLGGQRQEAGRVPQDLQHDVLEAVGPEAAGVAVDYVRPLGEELGGVFLRRRWSSEKVAGHGDSRWERGKSIFVIEIGPRARTRKSEKTENFARPAIFRYRFRFLAALYL